MLTSRSCQLLNLREVTFKIFSSRTFLFATLLSFPLVWISLAESYHGPQVLAKTMSDYWQYSDSSKTKQKTGSKSVLTLDYIYKKETPLHANGCYLYFRSNLLDFIKRHRMLFRSKCSVKDKHSGFHEVYCFKKNSSCESTLIYSSGINLNQASDLTLDNNRSRKLNC